MPRTRPDRSLPASASPDARGAQGLRGARGLRGAISRHLGPSLKFLTVGGIVFLVDTALYNLLVFWHPGDGWGHGLMFSHPITAKILTIALASCLTYLGNRLWTYADRPAPRTARSIMLFALLNVLAAVLQLACLGFSRYVLGLDSPLADNVSGTLVGQAVSTAFRYVTYGTFVFPRQDGPGSEGEGSEDDGDDSENDGGDDGEGSQDIGGADAALPRPLAPGGRPRL